MKGKLYPAAVVIIALLTLGGCIGYIWSQHNKSIVDVTVSNFQEQVLESKTPVFIEFYVPNCAPCSKEMALLEKIAKDYTGKVRFVRVDVRKSPQIAAAAKLRGVPTHLMVRAQDDIIIRAQGFADEAALRQFIEEALKAKKEDLTSPTPATPDPAQPAAPTGTPNAAPPETPSLSPSKAGMADLLKLSH